MHKSTRVEEDCKNSQPQEIRRKASESCTGSDQHRLRRYSQPVSTVLHFEFSVPAHSRSNENLLTVTAFLYRSKSDKNHLTGDIVVISLSARGLPSFPNSGTCELVISPPSFCRRNSRTTTKDLFAEPQQCPYHGRRFLCGLCHGKQLKPCYVAAIRSI
jgi:hypothetical protein